MRTHVFTHVCMYVCMHFINFSLKFCQAHACRDSAMRTSHHAPALLCRGMHGRAHMYECRVAWRYVTPPSTCYYPHIACQTTFVTGVAARGLRNSANSTTIWSFHFHLNFTLFYFYREMFRSGGGQGLCAGRAGVRLETILLYVLFVCVVRKAGWCTCVSFGPTAQNERCFSAMALVRPCSHASENKAILTRHIDA